MSKRNFKGLWILLLALFAALSLTACGSSGSGDGNDQGSGGDSRAELVSIAITPGSLNKPVGLTAQFTALGTFTDGSTRDISATVNWNSSNKEVATVDNNGLSSALVAGQTIISVTDPNAGISSYDSNNDAIFTVTDATLASIVITPSSAGVGLGQTLQLAAFGIYSDESSHLISNVVTWHSTDTTIMTVDDADNKGLVTGLVSGTAEASVTDPTTAISSSDTNDDSTIIVTDNTLDFDSDGILNDDDNCPYNHNPGQEDADGDGYGNVCELDTDDDGIPDDAYNLICSGGAKVACDDNCPNIPNPGQEDMDGDEGGDLCELDQDRTPDQFAFTDKDNADRSTPYISSDITVTGITVHTTVSTDNGTLVINGVDTGVSSGIVALNDTVAVKITSHSLHNSTVHARVVIGDGSGLQDVDDTYSVTTWPSAKYELIETHSCTYCNFFTDDDLNLRELILGDVNLTGSDLSGVDLYNTYLGWANLDGANLNNANMMQVELLYASLISATLTGAELFGANLTGANFSLADLSGADMRQVQATDSVFVDSNLSAANLGSSDLSHANFTGANLNSSRLDYTTAVHTNFNSADLTEADIFLAEFSDSDFSYADLNGSKNRLLTEFNNAIFWNTFWHGKMYWGKCIVPSIGGCLGATTIPPPGL